MSLALCVSLFILCCLALHDTSEPSLDTLKKYTIYSYAAYCTDGLKAWSCYWCKVKVSTIFENDGTYGTYGYVGASSQEILISFRGTRGIDDWLKDLDFFQTPYPTVIGAEVHRGFYESYTVVSDTIKQHLKELVASNPGLPVTVTGHSLGAAISVLCAVDIIDSGLVPGSKVSVINFGEPRVGNEIFSHYYSSLVPVHYRVVNMRDLVPHVPPVKFSFHHVPRELWFPTNATTFVMCNGSGEDPTCSDSLDYFDVSDHLTYLGLFLHTPGAC